MDALLLDTWIKVFNPDDINIDKVKSYLEFLKDSFKNFDNSRYAENHHIIPLSIDKNKEFTNQTIRINGSCHFKAHCMLKDCFNKYRLKLNSINSCAYIRKNSTDHGEVIDATEYESVTEYRKFLLTKKFWVSDGSKNKMLFPDEEIPEGFFLGRRNVFSEETKIRMANSRRRENLSEEIRNKISKGLSGDRNGMYGSHRVGELNPFYNKRHSDSTKKHLSEIKSECNKGRIWINNDINNKFINQEDLVKYEKLGYSKGRIFNHTCKICLSKFRANTFRSKSDICPTCKSKDI